MMFKNKIFVITGSIPGMTRSQAFKEIRDRGGGIGQNITKNTTVLIVGKMKNQESNKVKKAREYQLKGCDIEIITADLFLKEMNTVQLSFNI